jgi:type II secretory pathway pseudopilin PulG
VPANRLADRSGAILLETIVALTILTLVGITAVVVVSQSVDAARGASIADAEMQEASAFMDAVSLWSRADLDRRLGSRVQGSWLLTIHRPTETLYLLVLTDSTGSNEILRTAIYRRPAEQL